MVNTTSNDKERKVFAILFLLIAVFALIASGYTWGLGFLFSQPKSPHLLLPIVDLIVTFPLSLLAGLLMLKNRPLGDILGLVLTGCLLYGSVAVYIEIILVENYAIELILTPLTGILLSLSYIRWFSMKNSRNINSKI